MHKTTNHPNTVLVLIAIALLVSTHPVYGNAASTDVNEVSYSKDTYTYKNVGNHSILADVYRYSGEEIRPAVIYIHGGALIMGTREWLDSEALGLYLNAGFVVISIDYRLAPETKLHNIIEDLKDAYSWVRGNGPILFKIDPNRIAVVGSSAGGYLTLMAGFHLKPRPAALVSFYGYGDVSGPWYAQPDPFYNKQPTISKDQALEGIGDSIISCTPTETSWRKRQSFYLYCRQKGLWPIEVSGHDPVKELEWFSRYEPLRNITEAYPPTMLLHGKKDTDVPFQQSVLMAEALKRRNVDYEFVSNPDWGHGFDWVGMKEPSVKEAFDRVIAFLTRYLRSR